MVFLHGLMGAGGNWRKILTHFKDRYQILIFDQRGHGRSFHFPEGYAPENYADDLKKILDELGWDRIHLVGHSMGGRNAMNFNFRFPDRIEKLVIEDIGPEGDAAAMDKVLRLLDIVPTPFADKDSAKAFFKNEFPDQVKNHPQSQIIGPYLMTNIEEKADGTADWRFFKDGIIQSLKAGHFRKAWGEVEAIQCPCLWIRGENSQDLSRQEFEKIQATNPRIQAVEIPGSGHWVHFEKPAEFTQALESFLQA